MNMKERNAALIIFITLFMLTCTTLTLQHGTFQAVRHQERRYVILTVDDFGASKSINAGVFRGLDAGLIKSVAAIVTFPDSIEEIKRLHQKYEEVEVGLHFCITSGYPVSGADTVPTLVNEEGGFFPIDELVPRIKDIDLEELEKELRSQIEIVLDTGIPLACLSSHHHILNVYSPYFMIVLKLAGEYDLPVRSTMPVSVAFNSYSYAETRKWGKRLAVQAISHDIFGCWYLKKYCTVEEMQKNQKQMDAEGIKHTDYLVDSFYGLATPQNLFHMLANLPEGSSEIVFHIGTFEKETKVPSGIEADYFFSRECELFCVTSAEMERWLRLMNIQPINFADL